MTERMTVDRQTHLMPQNKTKIYSARHSKHTHPEIGTLWSLLEVKQAILRDAQTDPQTHVC